MFPCEEDVEWRLRPCECLVVLLRVLTGWVEGFTERVEVHLLAFRHEWDVPVLRLLLHVEELVLRDESCLVHPFELVVRDLLRHLEDTVDVDALVLPRQDVRLVPLVRIFRGDDAARLVCRVRDDTDERLIHAVHLDLVVPLEVRPVGEVLVEFADVIWRQVELLEVVEDWEILLVELRLEPCLRPSADLLEAVEEASTWREFVSCLLQ